MPGGLLPLLNIGMGVGQTALDVYKAFAFDLPNAQRENTWRQQAIDTTAGLGDEASRRITEAGTNYRSDALERVGDLEATRARGLSDRMKWEFGVSPDVAGAAQRLQPETGPRIGNDLPKTRNGPAGPGEDQVWQEAARGQLQQIDPTQSRVYRYTEEQTTKFMQDLATKLDSVQTQAQGRANAIETTFAKSAAWTVGGIMEGVKAQMQPMLDQLRSSPTYNPDDPQSQLQERAITTKMLQAGMDSAGRAQSVLQQMHSQVSTELAGQLNAISTQLASQWQAARTGVEQMKAGAFQLSQQQVQAYHDMLQQFADDAHAESQQIDYNFFQSTLAAANAWIGGEQLHAQALLGAQLSMPQLNVISSAMAVEQMDVSRQLTKMQMDVTKRGQNIQGVLGGVDAAMGGVGMGLNFYNARNPVPQTQNVMYRYTS